MKLWIDTEGREIAAQGGHIPLAVSLLPVSVIAPLQRAYEGEEFNEQVYEAMFQRGYLHASVTGHTVVLQQSTVASQADLPPAQQNWIEAKRLKGMDVKFNGR